MKTKEEVIIDAWGVDMPACGVDENGWSKKIIVDRTLCFIKYDHQQFLMGSIIRPKSLKGLENNNGWIKIEEDHSNLPEYEGDDDEVRHYWVMFEDNEITHTWNFSLSEPSGYIKKPTHYQPIVEPLKPLY